MSTDYRVKCFWGKRLDVPTVDCFLSCGRGIGPLYSPPQHNIDDVPPYGYDPKTELLHVESRDGWLRFSGVLDEAYNDARENETDLPNHLLKYLEAERFPSVLKTAPELRQRFVDFIEGAGWKAHPVQNGIYDTSNLGTFHGYIDGDFLFQEWISGPTEIDPARLRPKRQQQTTLERFLTLHGFSAKPLKTYLTLHITY